MNVPPVSVERVQKCVVNFEIYRFLKKAANLPHPPLQLCLTYLINERQSGLEILVVFIYSSQCQLGVFDLELLTGFKSDVRSILSQLSANLVWAHFLSVHIQVQFMSVEMKFGAVGTPGQLKTRNGITSNILRSEQQKKKRKNDVSSRLGSK